MSPAESGSPQNRDGAFSFFRCSGDGPRAQRRGESGRNILRSGGSPTGGMEDAGHDLWGQYDADGYYSCTLGTPSPCVSPSLLCEQCKTPSSAREHERDTWWEHITSGEHREGRSMVRRSLGTRAGSREGVETGRGARVGSRGGVGEGVGTGRGARVGSRGSGADWIGGETPYVGIGLLFGGKPPGNKYGAAQRRGERGWQAADDVRSMGSELPGERRGSAGRWEEALADAAVAAAEVLPWEQPEELSLPALWAHISEGSTARESGENLEMVQQLVRRPTSAAASRLLLSLGTWHRSREKGEEANGENLGKNSEQWNTWGGGSVAAFDCTAVHE
jgi:hypothetical protein